MTDKDLNRFAMENTEFVLREYFREEKVYVSANLFIYYSEGDPEERVAPDVFVVKGVAAHARENYQLWVEKQVPQVAFEFVSKTTRMRDRGAKLGIYAALGIAEYYLFDTTGEWMSPAFRAFRLKGDLYEEVEASPWVFSPELDLEIIPVASSLRFRKPGQAGYLRTASEEARRAQLLADKLRALGVDPD